MEARALNDYFYRDNKEILTNKKILVYDNNINRRNCFGGIRPLLNQIMKLFNYEIGYEIVDKIKDFRKKINDYDVILYSYDYTDKLMNLINEFNLSFRKDKKIYSVLHVVNLDRTENYKIQKRGDELIIYTFTPDIKPININVNNESDKNKIITDLNNKIKYLEENKDNIYTDYTRLNKFNEDLRRDNEALKRELTNKDIVFTDNKGLFILPVYPKFKELKDKIEDYVKKYENDFRFKYENYKETIESINNNYKPEERLNVLKALIFYIHNLHHHYRCCCNNHEEYNKNDKKYRENVLPYYNVYLKNYKQLGENESDLYSFIFLLLISKDSFNDFIWYYPKLDNDTRIIYF